jgi:hypothetical protein
VRPEHDELGIETYPGVDSDTIAPHCAFDVIFSLLHARRKI